MEKIRKAFGWWLGKWWHPLAVYWISMVLFVGVSLLDFAVNVKMVYTLVNVAGAALFIFLLLQLAVVFIAGIVLMFKKHAGTGIAFCLEMVGCLFLSSFIFFCLAFVIGLNDNDHFADNLKLPENVVLNEPLEEMGFFWGRAVEDDFQNALVDSLENGEKLAEGEVLQMPVLENLMSTEEGQAKLLAYLEASPNWKVACNAIDGLYATRTVYLGDGRYSMKEGHMVYLEPWPGRNDLKYMQYSFRIYLDGLPKRSFAKQPKAVVHTNGMTHLNTWIKAGEAQVCIHDEAPVEGNPMTKKMVELVEAELASMDMASLGRAGRDTEVTLYNGMQGGMYVMDIWCNPGEPGELSISANEITKGTKLSKSRLPEHNVLVYGSSEDKSYFSQIDFTIYEGNWEQYYGAHLQLWFTPENGEKRLLWEDDYRIQGWMR